MSNGKILIVDDSENIRSVLEVNFEYLGYDVLTARDGAEALHLVSVERPDVVVLDVMMPRQNGYQVCRRIKSDPTLSAIPIIFLSARGQREDRYWGKDCGADDYLTKPFSAPELERAIERLMSRRSRSVTLAEFEKEVQAKRLAGDPFGVLRMSFDTKALTVFRQKYGELRLHEAIEGVRQTIEIIVREEAGESIVWMAGDNELQTILPGGPERARTLCDRIMAQTDLLLKSFYDAQDAGQGYVVTRQPGDGREIHVPLLTMEAALQIESSQEVS